MNTDDINIKMLNHCVLGDLKGLKQCLKQGADLGFSDDQVFYLACTKGFIDIVKFCIKEGVTLCKQCFHMAAQEGNHEIVKLFVKHGIDVRIDRSRAFRWACANGHLNTARYLYNKGCKVFEHEEEALIQSASNGYLNTVKFLIGIGASNEAIIDAHSNAKNNGHKKTTSFLRRTLEKLGVKERDLD